MPFNQLTAVGRLTAKPEIKQLSDQTSVCNFSLAINTVSGIGPDRKDYVEFINCVAWNTVAQNLVSYKDKGQEIMVVGPLHTRNYEDANGVKQYRTEVMANQVIFLGNNPANSQSSFQASSEAPSIMEVGDLIARAEAQLADLKAASVVA